MSHRQRLFSLTVYRRELVFFKNGLCIGRRVKRSFSFFFLASHLWIKFLLVNGNINHFHFPQTFLRGLQQREWLLSRSPKNAIFERNFRGGNVSLAVFVARLALLAVLKFGCVWKGTVGRGGDWENSSVKSAGCLRCGATASKSPCDRITAKIVYDSRIHKVLDYCPKQEYI